MSDTNGRRIYDPTTAQRWTPKKEWVELSSGDWICVWEMSVAQTLQMAENAQRHPNDPRPGINQQEAGIWQLMYSCYAGEEPGSARIFADHMADKILELSPDDFNRLMRATDTVGGAGKEVAQAREDFTAPPREEPSPSSPTGASSTSAAAPAK